MVFCRPASRVSARIALLAALFGLAACQSGDLGLGSSQPSEPAEPDQRVRMSEIEGYCPNVSLRDGTAYYSTHESGAQDDPTKLIYQASISAVTRACTRSSGTMNIEVAVAGRVVPGPLGRTGAITMPIRVVLMQGSEVLYSQLHSYQVTVADAATATQFLFKDPGISVPIPDRKNLQLFAGFDDGSSGR